MTMHPLDPLSPQEIRAAVALLRSEHEFPHQVRFVEVSLVEPEKQALLAADNVEREVRVVLLDPATDALYEASVSLTRQAVTGRRLIPEAKPPIMPDEYREMLSVLKDDPGYRAALARRGVDDLELVSIDAIPAGHWGNEEDELGRRFVRALSFVRPETGGSAYARQVDGLIAFVDLNRMEVFRVDDHGVVPLPADPGEYRASRLGQLRTDLRPLELAQPEGPSFEIDGHEVRWQRWRFRLGFTLREGLVLHLVRYEDGDRERSVLHRASYTELAVPYGHPSPTHYHQSVLDLGEQQFGALANTLELGCDCLGEIRYLDAVVNDSRGEPLILRNAVCLHEEDHGILWKHVDSRTGDAEVRRGQRLVVSWIATTGNYEYGFYWYLYQDGSIESEVKLTGILQTAALEANTSAEFGELVAPGVNGMIHQHLFNVRLDFDVDGTENSVYEQESAPAPPGDGNPWGNAFQASETLMETELEAQRLIDPLSARSWKIVNPNVLNHLGRPVAYRLVPGDNVLPLYDRGSGFGQRTGFTRSHLWVTPYEPGERYATGEYPVQQPYDGGLPEWTQADRRIANRDIVVWYTFGHHHVPRPEDWPVMPVASLGFALRPAGFFDRNPALDVAPADHR
jgi:primary-amine oxidase